MLKLSEIEKDLLNLLKIVQRNEDNKQFINPLSYRLNIIKWKLNNIKTIIKIIFKRRINTIYKNILIIENILNV